MSEGIKYEVYTMLRRYYSSGENVRFGIKFMAVAAFAGVAFSAQNQTMAEEVDVPHPFNGTPVTILEQRRTIVAAAPIPSALITLVEVASVGHVPKIRTRTGFSLIRPLVKFFKVLTAVPPLLFYMPQMPKQLPLYMPLMIL